MAWNIQVVSGSRSPAYAPASFSIELSLSGTASLNIPAQEMPKCKQMQRIAKECKDLKANNWSSNIVQSFYSRWRKTDRTKANMTLADHIAVVLTQNGSMTRHCFWPPHGLSFRGIGEFSGQPSAELLDLFWLDLNKGEGCCTYLVAEKKTKEVWGFLHVSTKSSSLAQLHQGKTAETVWSE